MALPQDFWQNEHMFQRFRSKPCQRLLRSGLCEWQSQCQFSHDPEWPRRTPNKYNYSPAPCPHLRPVMSSSGEVHLENTCRSGLSCAYSHTKDEVLYHPSIFKTSLCEEHRSLTNDQRSARRSKHRPRCHRYYCPFGHGKAELRSSPMSPVEREAVIQAAGIFPSATCCGICNHNQLGPACCDASSGMGYGNTASMGQEASMAPSQLWPGSAQTTMLGQMSMPAGSETPVGSETSYEGNVWCANPWLQQPMHQEAGGLDSQNLTVSKEQMLGVHLEQESTADGADGEVDSEIYERAVRFIEELSTEESGSDDGRLQVTVGKEDAIKESGFNNGFPLTWNPQEADGNGQDRWQLDPAVNYWAMQSADRIA